jgi:hypothetical protein
MASPILITRRALGNPRFWFCVLCVGQAFGCAYAAKLDVLGAGAADGGVDSAAGVLGAANGGAAAAVDSGSGAATVVTVPPGDSTTEVCDGIDNDGNGIIDDVDVQGDGVCDCLNIATIGQIGPWGDGSSVFKTWLNSRSPTPAVELGDQRLTDDLLRPYQVIVVLYVSTMQVSNNGHILNAQHAFSRAEVAAFERWVRAGGGVMTTIGYTSDEDKEVANVNRLLAPFGLAYSSTKLSLDGKVQNWIEHPLTTDVHSIYTSVGVEPDGSAGLTLAHDANNHVALQAAEADAGHLVVWGDEWITYDSEWQAVTDQQVERFWLNILKWTSPPKVCQVPIKPD